jgi:predicted aspartyl protease
VRQLPIFFVLAIFCSSEIAVKNEQAGKWQHFEYVARNVFVRCIVSGPTGEEREADFIIDTGLNRTTVSNQLAQKIGLLGNGTTRAHSPSGVKLLPLMELPSLRLGNDEKAHLQVVADDLGSFSTAYRHNVDGFLGTDFFAKGILSLDFPKRLISLDPNTKLEGTPILSLEATQFSGLLLVPVTLPSGLTISVIVDTGADNPTDFVFYEDALHGVEFHPVGVSDMQDQISPAQHVVQGVIESIHVGDLAIPQPSVTLLPKPADNPYGAGHRPGLLTCQFFEHYRSQIDFQRHRLTIYTPPM